MFDKLIDVVIMFLGELMPFVRLCPWEGGVLMRLGKYRKTIGAGIHPKIPFVDHCVECCIVETTEPCPPQSLTTADEVNVMVVANCRFSIKDWKLFLLNVTDGKNAILDQCTSVVAAIVKRMTWQELQTNPNVDRMITLETRKLVARYGVQVHKVTLTTCAKVRTLRII